MKILIDISEHTRNVIARYMDGTGFDNLPVGTINMLAYAVMRGEVIQEREEEEEEEDDGCKRTDEEIL